MLKYFYEVYESMPRQGPGRSRDTLRALSMLTDLPENPRLLDVGCGTGGATMDLARATDGAITAVDNHVPFLDILARRATEAGVDDRVHPRMETMFELPFAESSFDLIWAEGSIYIVGFAVGLESWRPLLVPDGYLVVTEVVWRTQNPPEEASRFWRAEYPAIAHVEANLATARSRGYRVLCHFPLAREGWWENYYQPLKRKTAELRRAHASDTTAQQVCDTLETEIALFESYGDTYGYEFFVLQKS